MDTYRSALGSTKVRLSFDVCDDGPGIAPEYHERIFELFQTLQPRDQLEASGMGLAIVKKTVESAGGHVSVQSAEGKGTCFTFTWPIGSNERVGKMGCHLQTDKQCRCGKLAL